MRIELLQQVNGGYGRFARGEIVSNLPADVAEAWVEAGIARKIAAGAVSTVPRENLTTVSPPIHIAVDAHAGSPDSKAGEPAASEPTKQEARAIADTTQQAESASDARAAEAAPVASVLTDSAQKDPGELSAAAGSQAPQAVLQPGRHTDALVANEAEPPKAQRPRDTRTPKAARSGRGR